MIKYSDTNLWNRVLDVFLLPLNAIAYVVLGHALQSENISMNICKRKNKTLSRCLFVIATMLIISGSTPHAKAVVGDIASYVGDKVLGSLIEMLTEHQVDNLVELLDDHIDDYSLQVGVNGIAIHTKESKTTWEIKNSEGEWEIEREDYAFFTNPSGPTLYQQETFYSREEGDSVEWNILDAKESIFNGKISVTKETYVIEVSYTWQQPGFSVQTTDWTDYCTWSIVFLSDSPPTGAEIRDEVNQFIIDEGLTYGDPNDSSNSWQVAVGRIKEKVRIVKEKHNASDIARIFTSSVLTKSGDHILQQPVSTILTEIHDFSVAVSFEKAPIGIDEHGRIEVDTDSIEFVYKNYKVQGGGIGGVLTEDVDLELATNEKYYTDPIVAGTALRTLKRYTNFRCEHDCEIHKLYFYKAYHPDECWVSENSHRNLYTDFNNDINERNDTCAASNHAIFGWPLDGVPRVGSVRECYLGVNRSPNGTIPHISNGIHGRSHVCTSRNAYDDICVLQKETCGFDTSKPETIPSGWVPEVEYIDP